MLGARPLLVLLALAGIGACAGPRRPTVRVRNERATSATVQFQDVTGKLTSINNVPGGGASAFVEIEPGVYAVTALIANESVAPTLTFSAARGQHYTVVVLGGTPPALSVEGPLPLSPGLTDPGARPPVTLQLPITLTDVRAARERIAPFLPPTPLRSYATLDHLVGADIRVLVKHENHQPTNSFKVRNGLSALTAALPHCRAVVCASTGNHGQGVAYAGRLLETAVTVVVPLGNNPEKNEAVRALGAVLVESGQDYDAAVTAADRLAAERGLIVIHSTNNPHVVAGAATLTAEIVDEVKALDAMVVAVGGGSQAVGALVVLQALAPLTRVYAVQAAGAPAIYESWKARRPVGPIAPDTFAEGIATGTTYELTWPALRDGLAGFVLVSDAELAEAMQLLIRTTHNLPEPAGAAGVAGLLKLREELNGRTVAVVLSGGNVDGETLRRVLS